jgi:hypothetical protein
MRLAVSISVVFLALGLVSLPSSVSAGPITFVTLKNAPNGSSSIQSGTDYTTTNLGYAFKTGSSGSFDIDWVTMNLTSGAAAGSTVSFKISIHGTDNETAYLALPNSTVHATDTVTFTTLAAANQPFDKTFTSADSPNITSFPLLSNTAYSLFVNGSVGSIALRRTQGLTANTANDAYTVTNGFVMLDTFRNNSPQYKTSTTDPNTEVALAMSFGGTASAPSAVPEPATLAISTLVVGGTLVRRYRRGRRSI